MKIRITTNYNYYNDDPRFKDYNLSNEIELRELMTAFYKKEMDCVVFQYINSFESPSNQSALTKREQFAMAAMQGFISNGKVLAVECAELSIEYADALIKELEK